MRLALLGHLCAYSRRDTHTLQGQPVLLSIFQLDELKQDMTSDVIVEGPCQGQHPSSPLPLLPLPPLNPPLYHVTAQLSPCLP